MPTTASGHYRAAVYEGDIEWTRLTLRQRIDNAMWGLEAQLPAVLRKTRQPRGMRRGDRCHYRRPTNRLVDVIEGDNLVVTNGKQIVLDRLYGLSSILAVVKMGVGTSNTAAAAGDTALTGADFGPAAFDSTPTRAALVVTSIQTWGTAQGNIVWAEMGEFTAANSMLSRVAPIGPFTKTTAVSIILTYTLTAN